MARGTGFAPSERADEGGGGGAADGTCAGAARIGGTDSSALASSSVSGLVDRSSPL
ncbi:MAG: hypothetical protein KF850_01765 [Labilithrix sp.]|nr:hypothetical protein [Labilithrix sp.]